jgi:hypothetical protein
MASKIMPTHKTKHSFTTQNAVKKLPYLSLHKSLILLVPNHFKPAVITHYMNFSIGKFKKEWNLLSN